MDGYIYFLFIIVIFLLLTSFRTTRNLIKQYLSELLTTIGGIGLTIVDIMSDSLKIFISNHTWKDSWAFLLILFVIILFSAVFIGAKRNLHNKSVKIEIDKNKRLNEKIELYKKEYYKLCSNNIFNLFQSFYTTGNDRISIYKHQGDHFTLLGRYAKNPLHNKSKLYDYKENEGLIGKGWSQGEAIITGAPKWVGNGNEYREFMKKKCKITDKRLKGLTMRSQSLYVKTLHDNSTAEDPDGLIVFESLSPEKVQKKECTELISINEKAILTLLKNMKTLTKKITE